MRPEVELRELGQIVQSILTCSFILEQSAIAIHCRIRLRIRCFMILSIENGMLYERFGLNSLHFIPTFVKFATRVSSLELVNIHGRFRRDFRSLQNVLPCMGAIAASSAIRIRDNSLDFSEMDDVTGDL